MAEDHEAGIEAVAAIINRTRGEQIPVDDDDRAKAREAIAVYLSWTSPSLERKHEIMSKACADGTCGCVSPSPEPNDDHTTEEDQ